VLIDGAAIPSTVNAQVLYTLREAIHAGIQAVKAQTGRPLAGGDVRPDGDIATAARILEGDLTGVLVKVAFLRKLVSERTS
jgi:hypothetical protein